MTISAPAVALPTSNQVPQAVAAAKAAGVDPAPVRGIVIDPASVNAIGEAVKGGVDIAPDSYVGKLGASKAWVAGIFGGVMAAGTSLATALVGTSTLGDLSIGQWLTIAVFSVGTAGSSFGLTYHTTNTPK